MTTPSGDDVPSRGRPSGGTRRAAVLSFRLRMTDGVSVVAAGWERVLRNLGFDVVTVAGEGPVDRCIPGLSIGAAVPPSERAIRTALADADLVVVENLCTIPLNLPASRLVGHVLARRPAILHHHDPPWQRSDLPQVDELPPDDAAWRHVTVNRLTRADLARRRIESVCIYPGLPSPRTGDRSATRAALGLRERDRLVLHPVRAIPRKNIPAAVALAEALSATYWMTGAAEDGYAAELERLLSTASCPVVHGPPPTGSMDDAYAAADLVVFPSTWEGFGNPPIEAALHRRPAAVGNYPVAHELRRLGFLWFNPEDPPPIERFLSAPRAKRESLLRHNQSVAQTFFSEARAQDLIAGVIRSLGQPRTAQQTPTSDRHGSVVVSSTDVHEQVSETLPPSRPAHGLS